LFEDKKLWLLFENRECTDAIFKPHMGNLVQAKDRIEAIKIFKNEYPFHEGIDEASVRQIKMRMDEDIHIEQETNSRKDFFKLLENDMRVCFRCGKKVYPTIEDINVEEETARIGHTYLTIGGRDICDDCASKWWKLMTTV